MKRVAAKGFNALDILCHSKIQVIRLISTILKVMASVKDG